MLRRKISVHFESYPDMASSGFDRVGDYVEPFGNGNGAYQIVLVNRDDLTVMLEPVP